MTTSENATGTLDGIGQQDHSVTSEYRIFGPPGTGKTSNLTTLIRRAVEKYGSDAVLVTSFSRAAAAELAGRDLPIRPERIGTLHSHCYHALNEPHIAEANVRDWNARNPHLTITPVSRRSRLDGEDSIEDLVGDTNRSGDSMLQKLNRHRGLMIDPKVWPAAIRDFERKWSQYKRSKGLLDFCDLIDICLRDVAVAPNRPQIIFADEAQDLNIMQLRLIRKWGAQARYFVIAGDDDQTIFSFTGASPEAILDPDIPDDHKVILQQSHRVPAAVQRVANSLIHQLTRRQPKAYRPRPESGAVERLSAGGFKSPDYLILSTALKHLDGGKTIMFLASCSFMLQPLVAVLRKNAISFHNPYRKANGFWNQLRIGKGGSAARRILALLGAHPGWSGEARPWTYGEVALWTEWLSAGILKKDAAERLQRFDTKQPVSTERLREIIETGAHNSLLAAHEKGYHALLTWWRARVRADVFTRVQYPADLAAAHGPRGLIEKPIVIVGTVHSVKGGEADVVYLFPDLSRAADSQYQRFGPERDSVIRVFYVGATRARETLYICSRESGMAVSI